MFRIVLIIAGKRLWRGLKRDEGQAMVESALIIPLMTFLILAVIQLVMIQHAKVMTEYAAFNAARAGIVWNADRIIMENAAIISLMPTYEGLFEESDLGNPMQLLKRILQRALLYQVNRRLPQAIDLLKNGAGNIINQLGLPGQAQDELTGNVNDLLDEAERQADQALQTAITGALGKDNTDTLVQVTTLNPTTGDFGQRGRELDFDDFSNRDATRLTIQVRYLYYMRIPFANWVMHQAWLAGRSGQELYGAIWNPQADAQGETGFRNVAEVQPYGFGDSIYQRIEALADQQVYMIPLYATYTMRMQSNPYKQSLQVQ